MKKEKINSAIKIFVIIAIFIITSYIAQSESELLKSYIKDSFIGMIIYIFILIVFSIIAPINEIVLMPIATASWGWFIAGILTLTGWTIGSAAVFFLSRKFGVPIIKKFIPISKMHKYEKFMPKEHLFIGIIFLRLAIPIDLVSYAIGLFTNIKFWPYFFATIIGFMPLAFFIAYIGTLPVYIQVISIIILIIIIFVGFFSIKYRKKQIAKHL
ncbi:MAG TPA: VTT domain-containing protein [Candidatus Paceibacterota bacterium]|nr:VTT domain-containing protein [Candidatus Paceibacterota bacterium]